jgi:hypothetical protein
MKKTFFAASCLPVVAFLLAGPGCKKKEEETSPPPPVSIAPTPTPTPAPIPVAVATEEEAGPPEAGPTVKVGGKPADVAGLRACCAALKQNAASMPPDQAPFALQAASVCEGMVAGMASGSVSKAGVLGLIGATLKGAKLPPACH